MATALILEDDESLRAAIADALQAEGVRVAYAASLEEGLEAVARERFSLIYCAVGVASCVKQDVNPYNQLQRAHGLTLLAAVNARSDATPVILVAATADTRIAAEALKLGAFAYWLKPVAADTLLFTTRQALEHNELLDRKERLGEKSAQYQRELEDRVAARTRELTAANLRLSDENKERLFAESALLKTHSHLEQRIRDRTAEIQTANKLLQQEILDRREAENALLESEERYRTLFQNASDAILLAQWDPENLIGAALDANDAACRLIGLNRECIVGLTPQAFFESPPHFSHKNGQAVPQRPQTFEVVFKAADATRTPAEANAHVFSFRGQNVVLAIFRDISLRKRAEQLHQLLARELITAQEAERLRIARDIHDNIGQDLLSLKIGLKMLLTRKPATAAELNHRVLELAKQLQDTLTTVRDLAYDLRPPSLDQLGLIRTIYQYCEDFSARNNLLVEFACAGMEHLDLGPDVGINLYRIIQEALNNIKKHAQASHVAVKLVYSHPNILLRIEDNGKGFDVESRLEAALTEKRMGLQSMKERVALLGGALRLRSKQGKGALISIQVPHREVLHEHY